jgi:hypothetical protein
MNIVLCECRCSYTFSQAKELRQVGNKYVHCYLDRFKHLWRVGLRQNLAVDL